MQSISLEREAIEPERRQAERASFESVSLNQKRSRAAELRLGNLIQDREKALSESIVGMEMKIGELKKMRRQRYTAEEKEKIPLAKRPSRYNACYLAKSTDKEMSSRLIRTALNEYYSVIALLDDNARELILASAFRVTCADGQVNPEEHAQLRAIATTLGSNEGVLALEIARFQSLSEVS